MRDESGQAVLFLLVVLALVAITVLVVAAPAWELGTQVTDALKAVAP